MQSSSTLFLSIWWHFYSKRIFNFKLCLGWCLQDTICSHASIQTWYPKYTGLDFLQFIAYRIIITTRKISTEYSSFVFWHHQVNLLICSWWQVWAETTLQGLVLEVLPHLVITPIVLGLALSSSRSADRLPITSDPQKPRISHCLQPASNRFVPNFVFCSSFTSFGN